jgi:hypothetical protein
METYFGYPVGQWERAREEARQILVDRARLGDEGDDITYSELCEQISSIELEPHSYALSHLLGEISEAEHQEERPLLSVLVVLQETREPGAGFFDLARRLGYDCANRLDFWVCQRRLTGAYWSGRRTTPD